MVFSNDFDIVFANDFLIKYSDTYYESYNSSARVQNLFVYVFIAYRGVLKNKRNSVFTNTVQLSLFTVYLAEMLQNIIQRFAELTKQSFTVNIKYTLADVTLFWPFKLGNTTLILCKDDFEFVS